MEERCNKGNTSKNVNNCRNAKITLYLVLCYGQNKNNVAESFCCQVSAWFPDMFCGFCLVKNHKIAYNSLTTECKGEMLCRYFEFL
jgi:hypothetical protein